MLDPELPETVHAIFNSAFLEMIKESKWTILTGWATVISKFNTITII